MRLLIILLFMTAIKGYCLSYSEFMSESPQPLQEAIKGGVTSLNEGEPAQEELQFKLLDGGFSSSRPYLFALNQKKYVLRVLDSKRLQEPQISLYKYKRVREVLAHNEASRLGLAPKLLYADPEALIIIMEYIEGHVLSLEDLENEKILRQLGSAIKIFHQSPVTVPENRTLSDRVQKHYNRALEKDIALPTNFDQLYDEFMQERVSHEETLCHGDLHPDNILVSEGRIYFIDWAGACRDDPYNELGYLSYLTGISDTQMHTLLEAYLGEQPSSLQLNQLARARARTCFAGATIWFDFSENFEDQLIPKQTRIAHLDQLLHSPDLKRGQEYILAGDKVNPTTAPTEEVRLLALGFLKDYVLWYVR